MTNPTIEKVPDWLSRKAEKPREPSDTKSPASSRKHPHIIGIGRVRFISLYALGMTFGFRSITETAEYLEPLGIPITAINGREYLNLEALENALDEATRSGGKGLSSKHIVNRINLKERGKF